MLIGPVPVVRKNRNTKIHWLLAWVFCNLGFWVKSGGYHWRNKFKPGKHWKTSGQYMAYGKYPGCIRSCERHDLSGFKFHKDRGWSYESVSAIMAHTADQ